MSAVHTCTHPPLPPTRDTLHRTLCHDGARRSPGDLPDAGARTVPHGATGQGAELDAYRYVEHSSHSFAHHAMLASVGMHIVFLLLQACLEHGFVLLKLIQGCHRNLPDTFTGDMQIATDLF